MGNQISTLVNAVVDERSGRGREYSGITVSGHARVQNGDTYVTRNYYSGPIPSPESMLCGTTQTAFGFPEHLPLRKRKQAAEGDDEVESIGGRERTQLDMAVVHLEELYFSVKTQKEDNDARRILRWLVVLLDAMGSGDESGPGTKHTEDEITLLQNDLLRADRVMVNSTPRKACSQVLEATRRLNIVNIAKWQIRLDTTACRSLDGERRDVMSSFSSLRLTASSPGSMKGSSVAAFFGETTSYNQRLVMHPVIPAQRTVSNDSEVFRLIEEDDPDGLVRSLAKQKATVRDCDEDGRSLLHVSNSETHPLNMY